MAPTTDNNARDKRSVPRPNPATFLRDFTLYMTTKYAIIRKSFRREFPFGNMVKKRFGKKIAAGKRLNKKSKFLKGSVFQNFCARRSVMMILNLSKSLAKPLVMAKLNMAYICKYLAYICQVKKTEQNCCCPHCRCQFVKFKKPSKTAVVLIAGVTFKKPSKTAVVLIAGVNCRWQN